MKLDALDRKIISARPNHYSSNADFTDRVMRKISQTEIIMASIRNMNVTKKETFRMKLKRLPKLAVIAITLGAVLLVSGTAYATYALLWPKPQVQVSAPTTSASGRDEVAISFKQCGDDRLATRYELKKSATITADQVAGVVKARCELSAIGTWAENTFAHDGRGAPLNLTEHDETGLTTSMATHIKSRDDSSITFVGLTKYNETDTTMELGPSVRYIVDGKDASASDITENDPIVYIMSEKRHLIPSADCNAQHCSMSSSGSIRTLLAVVKLSSPFENYDQFAWQSLTEVTACAGNPQDDCLSGFSGSIDLYYGTATPNMTDRQMKEIQGVITAIQGTSVTIRSSSGSLFTIHTPTDVISSYNTNKAAQYYNNQIVQIGSHLVVSYVENPDQHNKTIVAENLFSIRLQIEIVGKSDPVQAY